MLPPGLTYHLGRDRLHRTIDLNCEKGRWTLICADANPLANPAKIELTPEMIRMMAEIVR